jgi:hypothetical protein
MRSLLAALLLLISAAAASAQDSVSVPFDAEHWDILPNVPHDPLGTPTLGLHGGEALLKGVTMADGVIDVDLLPANGAAFAGIVFRAASVEELELVYVRAHKTRAPDATQYTPRYHGMDAWQLFSGDGYISRAEFSPTQPTHLKLIFEGPNVTLFVGDGDKPALLAHALRPYARGAIGLHGQGDSRFQNFRYRELPAPAVTSLPPAAPDPNSIRCWQLSQNVDPPQVAGDDPTSFPKLTWSDAATLPDGLLNISMYRAQRHFNDVVLKFRAPADAVVARAVVHSSKAQRKKIDFAYSDTAAIFVNGRPLFSGKAAYLTRDPFFLGIASLGFDNVWADFKAGDNEIVVVTTETFGGWGLQFRFPDPSGLTLPAGCRN